MCMLQTEEAQRLYLSMNIVIENLMKEISVKYLIMILMLNILIITTNSCSTEEFGEYYIFSNIGVDVYGNPNVVVLFSKILEKDMVNANITVNGIPYPGFWELLL
jgi:hypothetical protein